MLRAKIDLRNSDRDQSQFDCFSRHQGNGCSQHSGPKRTEATRWGSIGCDPLKRRRSLVQRASTHQRLCRMVWALGMAACRSSQAVRPRGRRRCRGPGPSLRVLKAGCVSVVPYKVRAGHIIVDREAGVTQGVCTAQPAVFSQVVFMRERKRVEFFEAIRDLLRNFLPPSSRRFLAVGPHFIFPALKLIKWSPKSPRSPHPRPPRRSPLPPSPRLRPSRPPRPSLR